MTRIISLEEVKKHKDRKSVWTIIHNDIYDVTSFLEEHPGGEDSLLEVAGEDGTQGFEDVGHSDDARELLKKYKIGTLSPEDRTKPNSPCAIRTRKKSSSQSRSQSSFCSSTSCQRLPRTSKPEKTWRTFDGSQSSQLPQVKSEYKMPVTPRTERRIQTITVPCERERRESRPRGYPCESSSNLKWALLALGGAIVLGIVLKKYLASK